MFNFAIVGCGSMAHSHAQELSRMPEVKVVALVDPITARTAEFRQKYCPAAAEFASIESLFECASVKLDAGTACARGKANGHFLRACI